MADSFSVQQHRRRNVGDHLAADDLSACSRARTDHPCSRPRRRPSLGWARSRCRNRPTSGGACRRRDPRLRHGAARPPTSPPAWRSPASAPVQPLCSTRRGPQRHWPRPLWRRRHARPGSQCAGYSLRDSGDDRTSPLRPTRPGPTTCSTSSSKAPAGLHASAPRWTSRRPAEPAGSRINVIAYLRSNGSPNFPIPALSSKAYALEPELVTAWNAVASNATWRSTARPMWPPAASQRRRQSGSPQGRRKLAWRGTG